MRGIYEYYTLKLFFKAQARHTSLQPLYGHSLDGVTSLSRFLAQRSWFWPISSTKHCWSYPIFYDNSCDLYPVINKQIRLQINDRSENRHVRWKVAPSMLKPRGRKDDVARATFADNFC